MGDGLPQEPVKVVDKILSGQFIGKAELLRNNMEVELRHTIESRPVVLYRISSANGSFNSWGLRIHGVI